MSFICFLKVILSLWNANIAKMMEIMLISLSSKLIILFWNLLSKSKELHTAVASNLKISINWVVSGSYMDSLILVKHLKYQQLIEICHTTFM